jgi:hypothetical protein
VVRHIFQAYPKWIYTQRVTSQASYSPEYITPTTNHIISIIFLIKVSSAQCSNKTAETCLQPTFLTVERYEICHPYSSVEESADTT